MSAKLIDKLASEASEELWGNAERDDPPGGLAEEAYKAGFLQALSFATDIALEHAEGWKNSGEPKAHTVCSNVAYYIKKLRGESVGEGQS